MIYPNYSISLMKNSYLHGISCPTTMNMSNMTYDVTSFEEARSGSFNLIGKEF